jgi:hypothetical protein
MALEIQVLAGYGLEGYAYGVCQELNGRYNTHMIHRDICMPVPSCQGPLWS